MTAPLAPPPTAPIRPFRAGEWGDLVAGLRARAAEQPDVAAFTWLADGEAVGTVWTYAELDRRAAAVAAQLVARTKPGDRVVLLYPPGIDFVAAFWGCLYAGVAPTPVYPPRDAAGLPTLLAVARDAAAPVALTTREVHAKIRLLRWFQPAMRAMTWVTTDDLEPGAAGGPARAATEVALVQYTSGSTGTPRGAVVTHANLLANAAMLQDAWEASGYDAPGPTRFLSWLPLYHDMGLIGMVIVPVLFGASVVLMSPLHFLQRPARWLRAIAAHRAEVSAGPNFAYDLCVRKAAGEPVDLSSWLVAMNGAEPVRAETLARFAETFGPAGFRPEALYPCYGLAEATLFVTGGLGQDPPVVLDLDAAALAAGRAEPGTDARLLGCGRAWGGTVVRISDPETGAERAEDAVGEVWLRGPGVARGYHGREAADVFGARGDDGSGPWLRTGDLGFVRGGELFICGRLKDLVILRGRNLYPQDVERTVAAAHPALRPGCGVAFAATVDGEEKLVVVQEVDKAGRADAAELTRAVRKAVVEAHDASLHDLKLIPHGTLPKTSSGKVRRSAAREAWLAGKLPAWKGPK